MLLGFEKQLCNLARYDHKEHGEDQDSQKQSPFIYLLRREHLQFRCCLCCNWVHSIKCKAVRLVLFFAVRDLLVVCFAGPDASTNEHKLQNRVFMPYIVLLLQNIQSNRVGVLEVFCHQSISTSKNNLHVFSQF